MSDDEMRNLGDCNGYVDINWNLTIKWMFIFYLPFWVKTKITIDTLFSVQFVSVHFGPFSVNEALEAAVGN